MPTWVVDLQRIRTYAKASAVRCVAPMSKAEPPAYQPATALNALSLAESPLQRLKLTSSGGTSPRHTSSAYIRARPASISLHRRGGTPCMARISLCACSAAAANSESVVRSGDTWMPASSSKPHARPLALKRAMRVHARLESSLTSAAVRYRCRITRSSWQRFMAGLKMASRSSLPSGSGPSALPAHSTSGFSGAIAPDRSTRREGNITPPTGFSNIFFGPSLPPTVNVLALLRHTVPPVVALCGLTDVALRHLLRGTSESSVGLLQFAKPASRRTSHS